MFFPSKHSFLFLALLISFPLCFARLPTCARSSSSILGQEVFSPVLSQSMLYYAGPSPYLFVYDDYSQKIKSMNIETGEYNMWHQLNFEIGQMLFYPQGVVYIKNASAGGVVLKWNYYTSLQKQATAINTSFSDFSMAPFYPVYDKFTKDPKYYIILFDSTNLEIRDLDGQVLTVLQNQGSNYQTVCSFAENGMIITGDQDGLLKVWNVTDDYSLNNTFNFSDQHIYKVEFMERVKNQYLFLTADNLEKQLRVWSSSNFTLVKKIAISFTQDQIQGIKSISNMTAVIYGNGYTFDYVNIVSGKVVVSPTIVNATIVSVEALPYSFQGYERVAVLASDGKVRLYYMHPDNGIVSIGYLFQPLFPQVGKIRLVNTFKRRNVDNSATSYLAVVGEQDPKTVWFIDETTKTNISSYTFPKEVRGLLLVMGRYLPTFQDLMLVWYGDAYREFQIDEDLTIVSINTWTSKTNITVVDLNLAYVMDTYSYAYVIVVDQYNVTTILNITGTNMTSWKEPDGIKFFCHQNFFTNFAYCTKSDIMKVMNVDTGNFTLSSVYGLSYDRPISQPNMTACYSKNIVGGGYFMTSNQTMTVNWLWDGSFLSSKNFTNLTSLIIEGNSLFTAVNNFDSYVYEGLPGIGIINNYSVGMAPGKNGFMIVFLQNFFYSNNEKEVARYYLDCPMGTTQSNSLLGACFPNCNNSFISLSNSSCAKQCVEGTWATPIVDTYNNFTAKLCQYFNSTIMNCQKGYDIGNYHPICSKCDRNFYLLATDTKNISYLYNFCAAYGNDPRLSADFGAATDGTGVAKWCSTLMDNCFHCDWVPNHCEVCEWTYYRQVDGLCNACTNNTLFHNGSANGTGFCYNCSVALPYCSVCNGNDTNCTQCFQKYYFDERINLTCSECSTKRYAKIGSNNGTGFCRNCSDVIEDCLDCTEFGERCTLCNQKMFIDVDYGCTDCTEINKYKNGSTDGTGLCMYCNYSLPHCLNCYGDKTVCQLCMNSYFFYYLDNSCVDCTEPMYFYNGSTHGAGHCYDCYVARPYCNWCNNDPNHCDLCFQNYFFDENNTCSECLQTDHPHMFRNGSFNGSGGCLYCEDAIDHCNQCTDNATACTNCDQTYYIYYGINNCSECKDNTSFFNQSNDGSHFCYPCRVAFNNCYICDYNADKCLKCDEDYFVNEYYRCQPYSFRPEYTNTSLANSSLTWQLENNRRRLSMSDPCDYNRSLWSLDQRLHSYWVASLDFDFVDAISLWEIENVVKPTNITETQANYSDQTWTFYGNSLHNSLVLTGRHNAHYKAKYFCIYGNTFSDETKPGIFDFYMPDNTGDNGLLYIDMSAQFDDYDLEKGMASMTCALQHALKLGDTNQIINQNSQTCQDHRQSVNISQQGSNNTNTTNATNGTRRMLFDPAFATAETGSLMTYQFQVNKDPIYVTDPTVTTIQNEILSNEFFQNLTSYMVAFNPSVTYPTPTNGEFVTTTNMQNMGISYPIVTASFNTTGKSMGILTLAIKESDGFLLLGIEKNSTHDKTPSLSDLKKGQNPTGVNLDFYATLVVKQNQNIKLTLNKLNPNLFYYLYTTGTNIYGYNQSDIFIDKFATDPNNIIVETTAVEPDSTDPIPIIIGVVVGVVGLILIIIIVLCIIHRINMRNEDRESESKSKENKDAEKPAENPEQAPSIDLKMKKQNKEVDPKAPTFETLPLTGVVITERKE